MSAVEWSDAEILRALQMRDQGWAYRKIGKALARSESSVRHKLNAIERDLKRSEVS